MTPKDSRHALAAAVQAARAAGQLMRQNARAVKTVHQAAAHDLKLELDVRCQRLIERRLLRAVAGSSVWGEEGTAGKAAAPLRWVVDPIDGTVNFAYGIPHACVSIALQQRSPMPSEAPSAGAFETVVAVVYDPFCDELWSAVRGGPTRLNGRPVHVSDRTRLGETVVAIGLGKGDDVADLMLPVLRKLAYRVRKIRIMGSAALALTYVASGRFDVFLEPRLRFWDIAAGGLILECAGGEFWHRAVPGQETYEVIATNGRLRRSLERHLARARS